MAEGTTTFEIAYTVTKLIRCDRCGSEVEVTSRTTLPALWIRLTQRYGTEDALRACSWGCAARLAEGRS